MKKINFGKVKIIVASIISLLLIAAFSPIVIGYNMDTINNEPKNSNEILKPIKTDTFNSYSHTILGEYCTATWCGYCKYAHGALKNLMIGGWHPMYYVSLVDDVNVHSEARINEIGISGFPTVSWDGGYEVDVGSGSVSGAMATYNASIISCGNRAVADIDITLDVTWNGNANMDIDIDIDNNDASTYNGYVRVYVTETESSMGWYDTGGHPYTFAFLDYAFDQSISISGSGTWSQSKNWDGHDYNDGYGNDFGSIAYGNIHVIAAVFNSSTNYVDETAGIFVGTNTPPSEPYNPNPADETIDVETDSTLQWECDNEWFEVLTYDVYFGTDANPGLVSSGISGNSYNPGILDFDTTYYWKIVAHDPTSSTTGPIWEFTTRTNNNPNIPNTPNPENGAINVDIDGDLGWSGGDPDTGDAVTYDIYFGDTNPPPKIISNQSETDYDPGTLEFDTTYNWNIISWDEWGYKTEGPIWEFTTRTNNPPNIPSNPNPEDGSTDIEIDANLHWTGDDPEGDPVKYDIYFGTDPNPPNVATDYSSISYNPGDLEYLTKYYWRIDAWDIYGYSTTGTTWSFTTEDYPEGLIVDAKGPYYGIVGEPINFFGSASEGYPPYEWHWDFGDGTYSEEQFPTHTYQDIGDYQLTLTVTDSNEDTADDTTWAYVASENTPPNTPDITGPASGKAGTEYDYTFVTTDPDGNSVQYFIDWGDGTEEWTEPNNSGEGIILKHTWSEEGSYTIRVKAKDVFDEESDWATLEVSMPKNKAISPFLLILERLIEQFPILERILQPIYDKLMSLH